MTLSEGLKALYPRPMAVSHGGRLRGALGGAMALLVVLTHTHAPLFALFPAFTNSLLLVGMGLLYNNC